MDAMRNRIRPVLDSLRQWRYSLKEELTEEVYVLPAIIRFMRKNMKTITLDDLSDFSEDLQERIKWLVQPDGR